MKLPSWITFTGVDNLEVAGDLQLLAERYPGRVEFGVLLSASRAGTPRYPDRDTRIKLYRCLESVRHGPNPLALHLCGAYAEVANKPGDLSSGPPGSPGRDLWLELHRWRPRAIQVNHARPHIDSLSSLARRLFKPTMPVIAQTRAMVMPAPEQTRGGMVRWLFDRSGGRGQIPDEWPNHRRIEPAGFAGGINPDNVIEVIEAINRVNSEDVGPYWIDMETGIRTDDRFDIEKVKAVLQRVFGN